MRLTTSPTHMFKNVSLKMHCKIFGDSTVNIFKAQSLLYDNLTSLKFRPNLEEIYKQFHNGKMAFVIII
jgi:hypothetical protein